MKIKEVCKLTDLTERTIRYYIERQLISPDTEIVNGREYRNYSKKDVEQLLLIAELRKLFFGIDSIIEMLDRPSEIKNILEQHQKDLLEETDKKQEIIEALKRIELTEIKTANDLVKNLQYVSHKYDLPECDIKSNFGKFDSETNEEKEVLSVNAWSSIKRLENRKKKKILVAVFLSIGILISSVVGFKIYRYQNRRIYNTCFITSVIFTQKYVNKSNELIGEFHVYQHSGSGTYDEFINMPIVTKFENDDIGNSMYRCILTNTEYAAVRLEISISIKDAKNLDVLIDEQNFRLNIKKILADENLAKKYAVITSLQGDLESSK